MKKLHVGNSNCTFDFRNHSILERRRGDQKVWKGGGEGKKGGGETMGDSARLKSRSEMGV